MIRFFPALIFYITLAFDPTPAATGGDESRYLVSACNIIEGQFSQPNMRQLWNGPGYPVFLAGLFLLGASLQAVHLANAFLLFFAVLLVHRTLLLYTSRGWCMLGATAFAIYWPVFSTIQLVLTETLAVFLFSASAYSICIAHQDSRFRFLILASIALACLAMTKVIFGYVLLASLFLYGILWLVTQARFGKKLFAIYAGAMLLCIPYLSYTFSITGRVFYWSTAGGSSLYWMSYPGPETKGEWKSSSTVKANPSLLKRHRHALRDLQFDTMAAHDRDMALRSVAFKNAYENPGKYFQNWGWNWLRMFFLFPFTPRQEIFSNVRADFPNVVVLCVSVLSVFIVLRSWRHVPLEIHSLLVLEMLYLGASSLASAYPRMFYVSIPVVVVYTTYALFSWHSRRRLIGVYEMSESPSGVV